jgi:hypothetical protein
MFLSVSDVHDLQSYLGFTYFSIHMLSHATCEPDPVLHASCGNSAGYEKGSQAQG